MPEVLTRRALNRATLARQLLLERSSLRSLDAVHHLAGLQAQTTSTWYTGLWGRLRAFEPEELSGLLEDRHAVRLSVMRGTIHLVNGADALAFRPVVQIVHDRMLRGSFGRLLVGLDVEKVASAGRAMVDEEPLTFHELGSRLQRRWPSRDRLALAMVVRARHALVQVPPRGLWQRSGLARHTSAEAWLGHPLGTDDRPDAMILRYLAAFGPASVMDAQAWSGLTRLTPAFERLRAGLVRFEDEHGREVFDLPDAPRPGPEVTAPVRLLYDYDNLFLSHADRTRFIPDDVLVELPGSPGAHFGMMLVDGVVAGWWQHAGGADGPGIVIHPWRKPTREITRAVTDEAVGLARFLEPDTADPAVRIDPP